MAILSFNAADVQPSQHDLIPTGSYEAIITESEAKPMKSGQGTGINFTFQIVSGPCSGRKLWQWVTYEHRSSPEAQRIGREQLSAICHAVGVLQLQDTAQLHNLPLIISVGIDKRDNTRNTINKYAAKAAATPAASTTASATSGAAPWAR